MVSPILASAISFMVIRYSYAYKGESLQQAGMLWSISRFFLPAAASAAYNGAACITSVSRYPQPRALLLLLSDHEDNRTRRCVAPWANQPSACSTSIIITIIGCVRLAHYFSFFIKLLHTFSAFDEVLVLKYFPQTRR